MPMLILTHACVSVCFSPLFCHQSHGDNNSGQGAVSIRKTVLPGMAIPMLKIRRPTGRLIFNMGIPIPGKTVFYIETGPSFIPSSPLHFLTVSAIPPCLCGTFPKFGHLLSHRDMRDEQLHCPRKCAYIRGLAVCETYYRLS